MCMIHAQTSTVQPLKSSNILLGVWLLIDAVIKSNLCQ